MRERRLRYIEQMQRLGFNRPDEKTMHLLWQIVDEGVLGASNHVRLAQELLAYLLDTKDEAAHVWQRVEATAQFIADTRGREAPVVGNVLRMLLNGLNEQPFSQRQSLLAQRIENWQSAAEQRLKRLVSASIQTLGAGRTVVAYDYSSTVAAIVIALCAAEPSTRVVVPESRAIAGGRRYLEAFVQEGIAVHFALDAAFEQFLNEHCVVLLGAESLRCDGSLLNTVGSLPLARLARWRGCPVFGCSDLLKLDLRSYDGFFAAPALRSFEHLLTGIDLPNGACVTTSCAELDVVPAELISGFFTDHGPIPTAAIWGLGREVFNVETRA